MLNMGAMDNSPNGKLRRTIFLAFAEFERDMIVERTAEGRAEKRRTDPNYREGRKPIKVNGFEEICENVKHGNMTVVDAVKHLDISRRTWYNMINRI